MLFPSLVFYPSYGTPTPQFIFDNSQYPNSKYFADHGMFVKVHYPSDPGPQVGSITVKVTSTKDPSGLSLTFNRITGLNDYVLPTTYVYFSTVSTDPVKPAIWIQSSYVDTITVQVTNPSDSTTGQTGTQSATYGTLPAAGPQPDLKKQITCTAGADVDGICKEWKNPIGFNGLKIAYGTGKIEWACNPSSPDWFNLCPAIGQNDVYVEIDYLAGHAPDITALQNIVTSFNKEKIVLHLQIDDNIPYHKDLVGPPTNGNAWSEYGSIKQVYFGTSSERTVTGPCPTQCVSDSLTGKRNVFHYALFLHSTASGSSGVSEGPPAGSTAQGIGNDMAMYLGNWAGGVGSTDEQGGTVMHELGHNLGLRHGGGDDKNCKPNYLSVMNYAYQFSTLFPSPRPLNYSGDINNLGEGTAPSSLPDEVTGVLTTYPSATPPLVVFGSNSGAYHTGTAGTNSHTSCINWNWDGSCANPSTPTNLNKITLPNGNPLCTPAETDTNEQFSGFKDWDITTNLHLNMWDARWTSSSMWDGLGSYVPPQPVEDPYKYPVIVLLIIIGILSALIIKVRMRKAMIPGGP